ncbi:hypothetical protein [Pseudonocardia acidicola]|uniref:TrbL/VirB6 plasmid conjugal transfer protein n=1 Tax=Pseudonocardia acidicola TaxID=2724939 RepID=A0ABX1SGD9_9PSEU|nr:hypothetical protein [Pseudonocardia acidicola]NMI00626.1 hypothetical protein [Pseudonocardia acidicola]
MGGFLGDTAATFFASVFDSIMKGIWSAVVNLLHAAFGLVDLLTGFTLTFDPQGNPVDPSIAVSWGVLRPLSLTIALGLFFWQLISTMLHGGRGFFRAASGPFAYGIALAATGGAVMLLLLASDELTQDLLSKGFEGATSFAGLLDNKKFGGLFTAEGAGQAVLNGVSAVTLGLIAIFGLLPAALGYLMEMVFREAAILVLVATIPITAAGLVAQTTASWFWRSLRWILAAVLMKPALALVMVIGVSLLANPQGLGGLLAGVGVLLIALFCPYTLFRLFSFVEPGTNAGAASRAWASSFVSSLSPGGGGGQANTSSGMDSAEASNTARFDQGGSGGGSSGLGGLGDLMDRTTAAAGQASNFANAQMDATAVGSPSGGRMSTGGASSGGPSRSDGGDSGTGGADDAGDAAPPPLPPPPGPPPASPASDDPTARRWAGLDDPPPPEQPPGSDGGGGGGPRPGGGGGPRPGGGGGGRGVSAGEVEEAAVVL